MCCALASPHAEPSYADWSSALRSPPVSPGILSSGRQPTLHPRAPGPRLRPRTEALSHGSGAGEGSPALGGVPGCGTGHRGSGQGGRGRSAGARRSVPGPARQPPPRTLSLATPRGGRSERSALWATGNLSSQTSPPPSQQRPCAQLQARSGGLLYQPLLGCLQLDLSRRQKPQPGMNARAIEEKTD